VYQFLHHHGDRPEFIGDTERKVLQIPDISDEGSDPSESDFETDCDEVPPVNRIQVITRGQARKKAAADDYESEEESPTTPNPGTSEAIAAGKAVLPDPSYDSPEYVMDPEKQQEIIAEYHNSALGGASGNEKNVCRLKPLFR